MLLTTRSIRSPHPLAATRLSITTTHSPPPRCHHTDPTTTIIITIASLSSPPQPPPHHYTTATAAPPHITSPSHPHHLRPIRSPRGIFLNQSKYALESLKKYGMETYDPMDATMVDKSKLDEDPQGKVVDTTRYRRMIGSLMYLTSSRPDLVFAVCMCAWYQAKPTEKHLHAVMTSNNVTFIASFNPLIMKYSVKISKNARILELK
ncbi:hypothetical protein Tco_0201895 [Tanacetum coccineum]